MEVDTRMAFVMPTEKDYNLMAKLAELIFVNEDSWTVEEYDQSGRSIEFEEAVATIDDAVEMVEMLDQWMIDRPASDTRDALMALKFAVKGTSIYTNDGEQCDFIIKREDGRITIQETPNYVFFGFGYFEDYDEFCDELEGICEDPQKLLPEEQFDPDCEYAITWSKIYVDDTPGYDKGYSLKYDPLTKKHIREGGVIPDGEIVDVDDILAKGLEALGMPNDEESIGRMSIEDAYRALAAALDDEDE